MKLLNFVVCGVLLTCVVESGCFRQEVQEVTEVMPTAAPMATTVPTLAPLPLVVPTVTPAITPVAIRQITYKLEYSSGNQPQFPPVTAPMLIIYQDASGRRHTLRNVRLPWSYSFSAPDGTAYFLEASPDSSARSVIGLLIDAEVLADGKVIDFDDGIKSISVSGQTHEAFPP